MLVELDLVVIQVKIWMVSLLISKQPNLLYFTAMLLAQVASTTRKTDVCRNIMKRKTVLLKSLFEIGYFEVLLNCT